MGLVATSSEQTAQENCKVTEKKDNESFADVIIRVSKLGVKNFNSMNPPPPKKNSIFFQDFSLE